MASPARTSVRTYLYLAAGPALGVITAVAMASAGLPVAFTAAVAIWMAVWWMTEAVPLAVTSLLPVAVFPVLGVSKATDLTALYMNDIVFLFIGGFMVALAMEKWNLHRRIALRVILCLGGGVRRTLLGFMIATGFISMWTSNTATTMMMVPIVSAVLRHYDQLLGEREARRLGVGLLLGVAYAASLGGIGTLVGTPPNLVFARMFSIQFPNAPAVSFAQWMFFATPLAAVLLIGAWAMLSAVFVRGVRIPRDTQSVFRDARRELGPMQREEKAVFATFLALVILWLTRESLNLGVINLPGWSSLLAQPSYVGDGTVAMTLAILLFILPSRQSGQRIMDWDTARKLPWGIVLLFGGGFALAGAISSSGLDDWIGAQMQGLASWPPILTTLAICFLITATSEFASNTATAQMALPILASAAVGMQRDPLFAMVAVTLAASCGFMLPVATPPNAIVFGTGRIRVPEMVKAGLLLDIMGIIAITLWIHLVGPSIFGGSPSVLPSWAATNTAIQP